MKILVVGKVTDNQVARLKEEAEKRGHTLFNCSSYDLFTLADKDHFSPQILGADLTSFNLIYLLTTGERKHEWSVACEYLNTFHQTVIIENKLIDPQYKIHFTSTAELYKQFKNKLNFPKTAVVVSGKTVTKACENFTFPVVIKATSLQRGLGVHLANSVLEIKKIITQNKDKSPNFFIREFIPNDGDIRVFTVGFTAIGAMKRTPKSGDFRSNISRGGSGEKFDLDSHPEIKEIAETLSRLNQNQIAGVDIIIHQETKVPYILEINAGPQFKGLEHYTGINAALKIIEYFESLVHPLTSDASI